MYFTEKNLAGGKNKKQIFSNLVGIKSIFNLGYIDTPPIRKNTRYRTPYISRFPNITYNNAITARVSNSLKSYWFKYVFGSKKSIFHF